MIDINTRINCFSMVLYCDSEKKEMTLDYILDIIKSSAFYSCKYYYCLHDLDTFDNGELKKPHYHLVVKLDNAISIKNIVKLFSNEIESQQSITNNLTIVKNVRGMIRYLIHKDNNDKYSYNYDDIVSNDNELIYYFNDNTTFDNLSLVIDLIKKYSACNMYDFINSLIINNDRLALEYVENHAYLIRCLLDKSKYIDRKEG